MEANQDKVYRVGIYCRVGRRDDGIAESAGIADQKTRLTEYVVQQGWRLVNVYADDGYSGIHFNRPAFQAMLRDIHDGGMDCIMTCDLARLSRNQSEGLLVLERFFPERKVRFLTLDGSVDTLNRGALSALPVRHRFNVKDSDRKATERKPNEGEKPANRRKGHRPTRG
ncbi:recombinase family protein [Paenibacillaceae bacterium WGS1546]|uniref:recombinase family protein n=1 Tax=Cohnella sp. WGS1546 TaxID=3366810 RepID=UPI00372D0591